MGFNLVQSPTAGVPLSTDDYDAQNQILQALLYSLMSKTKHLTEWDTLLEPKMAKNTYVQHGGALYLGNSDTAIGGAPANGRVYIKVTEAAGVLTFTFVNSAAGYSWNDAYCGFYHADDSQLLPYILYKTASGYHKYTLKDSEDPFDITAFIRVRQYDDLGAWNMDTTNTISIAFDDILIQLNSDLSDDNFISRVFIETCNIMKDINNQADSLYGDNGGWTVLDMANDEFDFWITVGGRFDNVNFNSVAINRGYFFYICLI